MLAVLLDVLLRVDSAKTSAIKSQIMYDMLINTIVVADYRQTKAEVSWKYGRLKRRIENISEKERRDRD